MDLTPDELTGETTKARQIGGSASDRPEALTTLGDKLLKGRHRD
jgi:hypothetical protein